MLLLDCSNTGFVYLEYKWWSSTSRGKQSLSASPVFEDAKGSSWRASWFSLGSLLVQVSYLLTSTVEGGFILREATEPWKRGCTCDSGWGDGGNHLSEVVTGLLGPVSRHGLELCIRSVGARRVIWVRWESLWRSGVLSSKQRAYEFGSLFGSQP